MRSEGVTAEKTLFLSRAGPDSEIAEQIGTILESAGYRVVLQQWDFANRSFMDAMHATLAGGARVVALLSEHYLASEYCTAEWQAVLADDPLNKRSRLIVMRVGACKPTGLLTPLAYWDLVPVKHDRRLLQDVVRNAVIEGRRGQETPVAGRFWRAPSAVLDPAAIRETPGFTGRDRELSLLDNALWDGPGRAVAHGLGGTGKSSLAREYAWRDRARYVAVGWLRADTEAGIMTALRWLGAQFVPELDHIQDRRQAAEKALDVLIRVASDAGKPLLLIFDNLEDRALLRAWQPREHTHVLVTSRKSSLGGGVARIAVNPLHADDAVAYLRSESGRPDLSDADLRAIAEAVGQLPLALSHAAAYLEATHTATARSYLDRLAHHMANAPADAEYPRAVFATFQEAIAKAEDARPGAAAILSLSAFFAPDAIPEELFRTSRRLQVDALTPTLGATAVPPLDLRTALSNSARVEEILGALSQLSLIVFSPESRTFGIHRLVQATVRGLLADVATAWVQNAVVAAHAAFPDTVEFTTWRQCERIAPHARAALAALPDDSASTTAALLAYYCGRYLYDRAAYADGADLLRRAIALNAASSAPYPALHIKVLNSLGLCLRRLNELSEAESMFREAVEQAEATYGPKHAEVAASLSNLGLVLAGTNRLAEAEKTYRHAHEIKEAVLDPSDPSLAVSLANIAGLLSQTNQLPQAAEHMRRALEIDEAHFGPIHPEVAKDLAGLGAVLEELGDSAEAERLLRRAIAIDAEVHGDLHPDLASHLTNLARLLNREQRFEEAEPVLRRALRIVEACYGAVHPEVAEVLGTLGYALYHLGERPEAVRVLRRAAEIGRLTMSADSSELKAILHNLGFVIGQTESE